MIKPIKHLGQNFLTSKKAAENIVNAADIKPDDIVLEAGPGKGILTELLLKKAKKVIAVEKDKRLAKFLEEKFSDLPIGEASCIKTSKLSIVHDDVLMLDLKSYNLQSTTYKIVANIPYYITSRFLRKFLSAERQPSLMVLMVQKEVGERIVGVKTRSRSLCFSRTDEEGNSSKTQTPAPAIKESLLSISVRVYGKPEILKRVPAGCFYPKPKVDSAIIKISRISKDFFKDIDERKFFETVKKGFSQKRKMLINNLKTGPAIFNKCDIPRKARAENLSLDGWKCLVKGLSTKTSEF